MIVEEGPIEARARINACPGQAKRDAEETSVEARAKSKCGDGWPKREAEPETEVEALVDRGRLVLYPGASLAVPVGELVERARGSRPGGEGSAADPRKFKTAGGSRREAEPIKRAIGFSEGGSSTDSRRISNEGLTKRGSIVTWPRSGDAEASNDVVERGKGVPWIPKRDAEPEDDLIERDPGLIRHPGGSPKRGLTPSRGGSYRREAEPIRISGSRGGHRREAKTVERSMKNPGGGIRGDSESVKLGSPSGHRREAEPAKWGGTSRREAVPEAKNGLNVAAGGGCPRDASPIKIGCRRDAAPQPGRLDNGKGHDARPSGGTRISRGLRGNGANPRGVRPCNGNNQRDITAETVEARGRFRGISSPA